MARKRGFFGRLYDGFIDLLYVESGDRNQDDQDPQIPRTVKAAATEFVAYIATSHLIDRGKSVDEIKHVEASDLPRSFQPIARWIQTLPMSKEGELYKTLLGLIDKAKKRLMIKRRKRGADGGSEDPDLEQANRELNNHIKHLVGMVMAGKFLTSPNQKVFQGHSLVRYEITGAPNPADLAEPDDTVGRLLEIQEYYAQPEQLEHISDFHARGDFLSNAVFAGKVLSDSSGEAEISGPAMVTLSQMDQFYMVRIWEALKVAVRQYQKTVTENEGIPELTDKEVMAHVPLWRRLDQIFDVTGDNKDGLPVRYFVNSRARLGPDIFWPVLEATEHDIDFFRDINALVGRGLQENKDIIKHISGRKLKSLTDNYLTKNNGYNLKRNMVKLRRLFEKHGRSNLDFHNFLEDKHMDTEFHEFMVNERTSILQPYLKEASLPADLTPRERAKLTGAEFIE